MDILVWILAMTPVVLYVVLVAVIVIAFLSVQREHAQTLWLRAYLAGMPECEGCDVCQPWAGFNDVPLNEWINPKCEAYARIRQRGKAINKSERKKQ
jgi:hypothetical protein